MNLIDKILHEWGYKCEKGYPECNNESDILILKELLQSKYQLNERLTQLVINKMTNEAVTTNFIETIKNELESANLTALQVADITNYYKKLPPALKKDFEQVFRSLTIQSFVANYSQLFSKFSGLFDITGTGDKSRGGVGKGEMLVIAMVKNSKSGGQSEKDILIGNRVYELKQFAKSGKEFLIAKDGSTGNSPALPNLRRFVDIIMQYNLLEDDSDLAKYIQGYVTTDDVDKIKTGTEIRPAIIEDIYQLAKEIREYIVSYKNESDELLTVGEEEFFLDKKEAEKITPNKRVSIKIGPNAKDEQLKKILVEFAKHPYVKIPEQLVSDIYLIVKKYFSGLSGGLILFTHTGDQTSLYVQGKPVAGTIGGDIKNIRVTTGTWKLAPEFGTSTYEFIQKQGE